MATKKSYITVTDQFCGAGGSSQGAVKAGAEVRMAMNHWRLAIETHNTNFPDTDHDCADLSAADPRRYPSTDILIASPECTNHSLAKGVPVAKKQLGLWKDGKIDPAAERSRATMWDVPRFAEYHKYRVIIVENVVDARKWVMFDAWIQAMHLLGYQHRCCYLNSKHFHPCPQSRDRMYVVFWQNGQRAPQLDYMPPAYCPRCERDIAAVQTWKKPNIRFGKYQQQYVYCCPVDGTVVDPYYYASFNCLDFSNPGTRIGDRPKPLSPNTRRRIEYGLKKYGSSPMMIANYSPGYARTVTHASPTIKSKDSTGLLTPMIVNDQYSSGTSCRVRSTSTALDTCAGTHGFKIVLPFIIKLEHSGENRAKSVTEAMSSQTTRESSMLAYVKSSEDSLPTQTTCQGMAFVVENKGSSNARGIDEPLGCVTSHEYLGLIQSDKWKAFLSSYYNGSNCVKHVSEEAGTITAGERHSLTTFKQPVIDDCYYRMLTPHEIKLAMAFAPDYVILGSGRDQVKQSGNAVTPPVMEWLIGQAIKSIA